MPRRQVEFRVGEYYHVYNRGHNRNKIFIDRESYLLFLRKARKYFSEDFLDVIAYCLMPNHYHLLVCLKQRQFSSVMQAFGLSFSKSVNRRLGQVGALFQGPFRAIHVDREEYLLHLSRYIHVNPLEAGLVRRAEDWEFSSYRDYLGIRDGSLPVASVILEQFESVEGYRRFVEGRRAGDDVMIDHLRID